MSESPEERTGVAALPRDDLTWCRVVIYAHVVILGLSLLATRLDRGVFGLSFETKQWIINGLTIPMGYGLTVSPLVTIAVLWRLKHARAEYRFGIFALEILLVFVQATLMLPLVQ
jgi:hypothetical protein